MRTFNESLITTDLKITEADLTELMMYVNDDELEKLEFIRHVFRKRKIYIDSYESTRNILNEVAQRDLDKVDWYSQVVNRVWKG